MYLTSKLLHLLNMYLILLFCCGLCSSWIRPLFQIYLYRSLSISVKSLCNLISVYWKFILSTSPLTKNHFLSNYQCPYWHCKNKYIPNIYRHVSFLAVLFFNWYLQIIQKFICIGSCQKLDEREIIKIKKKCSWNFVYILLYISCNP